MCCLDLRILCSKQKLLQLTTCILLNVHSIQVLCCCFTLRNTKELDAKHMTHHCTLQVQVAGTLVIIQLLTDTKD